MTKYIIKRIGMALFSAFIIMTILFVLIKLMPNEVERGLGDYDTTLKEMRAAWGYDKPIIVQYGIFLKNVVTKFDWGFCTTVGTYLQPVTEYIGSKLPATIYINVLSVLISIPFGILFGIIGAVYKNKWPDKIISFFIMLFISVPSFIYAVVLQYYVGYKLAWFPIVMDSGHDWFSMSMFSSAILPVVSLSLGSIAGDMRLIRAELSETIKADYMLLARTKGLTRGQAIVRHALRNSMIPVIPTFLADIIFVISGSLIIEEIFGVPGIGSTYIDAITARDYSVFMAISMFYVAIGLVAGIVLDLSYGLIDPRIRMGGGKSND